MQIAVIKASLEVTRPNFPHSAAMVNSAFKIFSVAASSVLKQYKIRIRIINTYLKWLSRKTNI